MSAIAVAFGGAVGALARFGIYQLISSFYAVIVVNVIGSFLALFLTTFLSDRFVEDPVLKLFLIAGVMGGFTTFSGFTLEVVALVKNGAFVQAVMSFLLNNLLSIVAGFLGIFVASRF